MRSAHKSRTPAAKVGQRTDVIGTKDTNCMNQSRAVSACATLSENRAMAHRHRPPLASWLRACQTTSWTHHMRQTHLCSNAASARSQAQTSVPAANSWCAQRRAPSAPLRVYRVAVLRRAIARASRPSDLEGRVLTSSEPTSRPDSSSMHQGCGVLRTGRAGWWTSRMN